MVLGSTPVPRTTRRCSKSPVIIRSSLLHVRGRRWRDSPSLASRSVRSGIGGRFRHSGQRDIFFAVAGDEREFAVLPVLLGGVDAVARRADEVPPQVARGRKRSEEHTSELQSLMRISYAVFCLKKKK